MIRTARRLPRLRAELSYVVLSAVLLVWTVAVVIQGRWVGDFALHVATVRSFAAHLASPPDPMIGTPGGSPYDSPYAFALAVVVRLTHLSPIQVLEAAAVANVVLLLVAWRLAAAQISRHPTTATVSLVAALLLWGWNPPSWSGFPNLWSVALTGPYPSMFALGLELLAWTCLWRLRRPGSSPGWAAGLGVLMVLLALVHPFTALTVAVGLAAIAVVRPRSWERTSLVALAVAAVLALALIVAWPFSSIGQLLAGDNAFDDIHRPLVDAAVGMHGMQAYGFMLLAVPALVWTLVARRDPELALMAVLAVLVFVAAAVTGHLAYARIVPLGMLAGALALGVALPTWWRESNVALARPAALALAVSVAALCCVSLVGQRAAVAVALPAGDLQRSISPAVPAPFAPSLSALDRLVADGETVAATTYRARRKLNAVGAFTLVPGWPDPFSPSVPDRQRAYDRLVAPGTTTAERTQIADRYSLRCVLVSDAPDLAAPGRLAPFDQATRLPGGDQLLCRGRRSL